EFRRVGVFPRSALLQMDIVSLWQRPKLRERRSNMKTHTTWTKLIVIVALGAFLSSLPAYSAVNEATPADTVSHSESFVQTAQEGNVVTEWNQQAITLALLPASALSTVQQARAMAIVHVAIHDAVNGITENYETYLSPGPAPNNSAAEAA